MKRSFIVLSLGTFFSLHAQVPTAPDLVGVEVKGLPRSEIRCMVKDHDGFLWIGTYNGLCRFDGSNVDVFRNIPGDSLSLPYQSVGALALAADGSIWVGTQLGPCVFDPRNPRFHRKVLLQVDGTITEQHECLDIRIDGRGVIWSCNHQHGFARYDPAAGVFREIASVHQAQRGTTRNAYLNHSIEDAAGIIWISDGISIVRYDPVRDEAKAFTYMPHGSEPPRSVLFLGLCADPLDSNVIWARSWGVGLVRFNKGTGEFTSAILTKGGAVNLTNITFSCAPLGHGQLLVGIDPELRPFDVRTSTFGPPLNVIGIDTHAFAYVGNCIYDDPQGQRWIGTRRGLFVVPGGTSHYAKWDVPSMQFTDDGAAGYWGTNQYVDRHLFHLDGNGKIITSYALPDTAPVMYEVTDICRTRNGPLWLATNKGLLLFDPRNGTFSWRRMNGIVAPGAPSPAVGSFAQLADGTIWANCSGPTMIHYDPATDVIHALPPEAISPDMRNNCGRVTALDREHIVIAYASNGFGVLNTKSLKLAETMCSGHPGPGVQNCVRIVVQPHGVLHAITANNGIHAFLFQGDSLRHLHHFQDTHLQDRYVDATADALGRTWIATGTGLVCFDPAEDTFLHVGPAEGSPICDVSQLFTDAQQRIVATGSRVARFDPATITAALDVRGIYIRSVSVNGTPFPVDHEAQRLRLPHTMNSVTVEYAPISLLNADRLHYDVKLEGHDHDWVANGMQRTVSYVGLSPGEYVLHVRVEEAGQASIPARFVLVIVPAWWQTWWFRSTAVLAMLAAVFLLARYIISFRYRQRIAVLEREREVTTLRTRIARDIHDDIGSGLTRITMLSRELNDPLEGIAHKEKLASSIATASTELIGQLSEIVWTVDPGNDHAERFVAYVRDMLGRQFEDLKVQLLADLSIEQGSEQLAITPDVKRNVVLVLKEAVSNALRHSGARTISVSLHINTVTLDLRILDDGRGSTATPTLIHGNGLKNMAKRAASVHAVLEMKSTASGTTVHLTVPLNAPTFMRSNTPGHPE